MTPEEVYSRAMTPEDPNLLRSTIVLLERFSVTCGEMQCMKPDFEVISPVIECYGELLMLREKIISGRVTRHCLPPLIADMCWKSGRNVDPKICAHYMAKEKVGYNILQCRLIFVPMSDNNHWWLMVMDPVHRKLYTLDSINPSGGKDSLPRPWISEPLTIGLDELFRIFYGERLGIHSWNIIRVEEAPQQHNATDCGVFTMKNMEVWDHGFTQQYSQDDIPRIRKEIVCDLILSQWNNAQILLC